VSKEKPVRRGSFLPTGLKSHSDRCCDHDIHKPSVKILAEPHPHLHHPSQLVQGYLKGTKHMAANAYMMLIKKSRVALAEDAPT
jgi:hypothetical protein